MTTNSVRQVTFSVEVSSCLHGFHSFILKVCFPLAFFFEDVHRLTIVLCSRPSCAFAVACTCKDLVVFT